MHAVTADTLPMRAVQSCPPWCTKSPRGTPEGGVHVHQADLGTAAGLTVNLWQIDGQPARMTLLDERAEVWQIEARDVDALAELLAWAAATLSPGR